MECSEFPVDNSKWVNQKLIYFQDFLLSRSIPISNFQSFAQIFLVDLSKKNISIPVKINANKKSDKIMDLMFNDFYHFRSSIIGKHFVGAK